MFGTRLVAFIIVVLLAAHVMQPTDGWFIALAVLIGLSMMRSLVMTPWTILRWAARDVTRTDWGRTWRRNRWAEERWR